MGPSLRVQALGNPSDVQRSNAVFDRFHNHADRSRPKILPPVDCARTTLDGPCPRLKSASSMLGERLVWGRCDDRGTAEKSAIARAPQSPQTHTMEGQSRQVIRISAALIDDDLGRLLLVRKAGTESFMQAGGKIEAGEDAWAALCRELGEEIGLDLTGQSQQFLGCFVAPAANEADCLVEAHLFHVRTRHEPLIAHEIAEAIWVSLVDAAELTLAPLTRDCVLPIAVGIMSPAQSSGG